MDKASKNCMKEAKKVVKDIVRFLDPAEYNQTETGFNEIIEKLRYAENLVLMARMFQYDLKKK